MRYRRYYRRRWRPYSRRRYGAIRPWFRRHRWNRRRRVRRRRRGYRKRPYVGPLVQWHPQHRTLCTIKGWGEGFFGVATNTTTNFQTWNEKSGQNQGFYRIYGGGVTLYHLTLDWLYDEHLKGHNTWSRSNEGFDLARYFGTTFYLVPHPTISYIFWWQTDYGTLKKTDYQMLHPAVAIITKKHIIVKSIKDGGRRTKRVRVPPPSVHNSQWYFMKQWCGAGLLRFGFTMINLNQIFIKTGEQRNWVPMGVSTGQKTKETLPNTPPVGTAENRVWYKYDWDRGYDNMIGWAQKKSGQQVLVQLQIQKIDIPYWQYYYGQGWTNFNVNSDMYYFWWWYKDPMQENQAFAPQDLKDKQKEWIWIGGIENNNYATLAINITQKSPWAVSAKDLGDTNIFNLAFLYKSRWQWGGTNPSTEPTLDPCNQPPAGAFGDPVRIGNPATIGAAMLHPWDLDNSGFITKDKFRQLLRFSDTDAARSDEEPQKKSPETEDSHDSEDYSDSSTDWDSEEEADETNYKTLTKRISRNRKFRHKLIRGIQRLLNN
ncbi:ORF1 [Thetatorquevirus ursid4]|uniref:Capsid protein n=1 Tax=Giant panda anellovirus TaxID=2016460 RepID=A0A220IGL6_9VIRU|nr:ORF1 [Giant panda anellovirus]ASH99125.1 ORF1 [Giant panda anellovirus]